MSLRDQAAREALDVLQSVVGALVAARAQRLATPHYEALRHSTMAHLLRTSRVPRLLRNGHRTRVLARARARWHDNQAMRWGARAWAQDRVDGQSTARRCGIPGG